MSFPNVYAILDYVNLVGVSTMNRICYQHDKQVSIGKGFKATCTIRAGGVTHYCCFEECVERLRQVAEVIKVEPFEEKQDENDRLSG